MDFFELGYFGLFIVCFLSATILPLASEGFLFLMLVNHFDPITCLIIATLSNSLGTCFNYWLGSFGNTKWLLRFRIEVEKLIRFEQKVKTYGSWLGIIAWVPIIGDPLSVACGFFKVRFFPFLMLVVIGKFLRYFLIIGLY
jgi:membrane protein YqaA with SNARE-associated domain